MAKEEKIEKVSLKDKILKRKKLIIFLVVLIAGFFGWRSYSSINGKDLETAEVKKGIVEEELILSGSIMADEHAILTFSSSGKISWVDVAEGDWVKKGQALAKLDTTSLNSAYQRALSDLRSADATAERVHDDVKDNDDDETYTQKETRTTAEVAKDKAWEAVLIAEENLRNATLLSPFEGLITYVANPFSGVNVIYTASQFEVVNQETIYFNVSADQSEIIDIHKDQKVNIILDSYLEEQFEGEVAFISMTPKSGELGSVYKVKVIFESGDVSADKLRIGMTGDAKFILNEKHDVLYVPSDFINSDSEGKYVKTGEGKNDKIYVELGMENEERVEISGDIKEGDTIYD